MLGTFMVGVLVVFKVVTFKTFYLAIVLRCDCCIASSYIYYYYYYYCPPNVTVYDIEVVS
jgi:hypothetical protein